MPASSSEAAQFTPYVAVDAQGMTFLVSTTDRKMGKFFAKRTRPELRVLNAALAHLEAAGLDVRNTTFVDGGANIGTTTLAALNAGFSSRSRLRAGAGQRAAAASERRAQRRRLGRHGSLEAGLSDRVGTAHAPARPRKPQQGATGRAGGDGEQAERRDPARSAGRSRRGRIARPGLRRAALAGRRGARVPGARGCSGRALALTAARDGAESAAASPRRRDRAAARPARPPLHARRRPQAGGVGARGRRARFPS